VLVMAHVILPSGLQDEGDAPALKAGGKPEEDFFRLRN
jgi:hypothetical protein